MAKSRGNAADVTKCRMRFESGNNLLCMQDMSVFRGAPVGIEFDVDEVLIKDGTVAAKLRAPGHGGNPYGNGAIYVTLYEGPEKIECEHCGGTGEVIREPSNA